MNDNIQPNLYGLYVALYGLYVALYGLYVALYNLLWFVCCPIYSTKGDASFNFPL